MTLPRSVRLTSLSAKFLAAVFVTAAAAAPLTVRALHHRGHVQVVTAQVTDGTIIRRITATGTLQPVTTVQVGAQVSGTIATLGADYNSIVRQGQVLATLEPSLFRAALDEADAARDEAVAAAAQAAANRDAAQTVLTDASTKLARQEALARRQLVAQADLDAARIAYDSAAADLRRSSAQLDVAQAGVAQARAGVEQARVNLDHTTITSPVDGIVVARSVNIGQTVAAAVQAPILFSIATDLRHIQIEVDIDESDIAGVVPGEEVSFQVESYPNDVFSGMVTSVRVQPVAEQTTTATTVGAATSTPPQATTIASVISYATIVDVPNPDERLRPGMTATVSLAGARRDRVIRIPSSALSFRPPPDVVEAMGERLPDSAANGADASRRQVWRFDGTMFTPVSVRVGLADDRWTELVEGPVRAGDALVTNAGPDR